MIEVDGDGHSMGDNPARDIERERWFDERGFRVLRIPARDVLTYLDGAVQAIMAEARAFRSH